MKFIQIIALFLTIPNALNARSLSYDFMSPGYEDADYLECDKYVRENHEAFVSDMSRLFDANKNKDWVNTKSFLNKYDTDNLFINNTFTQAIYTCGLGYTFSDGNNYYRTLYADIYMMIRGIKKTSENKSICSLDINERFNEVKQKLRLIINATNNAANKSLNNGRS